MREIRVYAPAKLNLYLDVLDKRPDGYHNIETIFEKIDLKDEIIIREKGKFINVRVEPPVCPSGKDNIAYRAVHALLKAAGRDLSLEIIIKKHIPVSGGLGGGSSDAGSLLRSINEFFGLGISREKLFSIASEIGKDVPFFLLDTPFAVGKGAGEILEPLDTEFILSHVIIKPDISISTAQMYKRLDRCSIRRTKKKDIKDLISAIKEKDLDLLRISYYNIFEEALAGCKSVVERAKILLSEIGAGPGFLSGSGPSVFCILEHRREAIEILKRIPKEVAQVFVATTCRD